jgi:5-formyltetrahydrofolate cyclo-ligase
MLSKQSLRQERKKVFQSINKTILKNEQEGIVSSILQSEAFKKAQNIWIYIALPDEVYLNEIIEKAWLTGKSIYIPKIEWENIEFYEVKNWQDTEIWNFWILEPKKDCKKLDISLDIIYITGQVFTKKGKRIGRGKGYYDRFLATHTSLLNTKKIWVCFSHQIVGDFEIDSWDIVMDEVIF